MPAAQPPPPWISPVSPVVVKRRFRIVAPYAAGGHRGIDLGVAAGERVASPCAGRVAFRGRVGGGPQTVTVECGTLRATLQRVEPAAGVVAGRRIGRGDRIGVATASAVDLSARRLDGSYLDPLPLLATGPAPREVPVVARPRRHPRPGRARSRPAELPAGALLLPDGIGAPALPLHARPGRRVAGGGAGASQAPAAARATATPVDWPLAVGGGLAALAAALTGLGAVRRSPVSRRHAGRLPILALVARDRR